MKTTIEIADGVYRQVKARAALQGQTVKTFFLEAIREKLTSKARDASAGWRAVFGKGDQQAIAEIQQILDQEFSRIDPEDWK